MVIKTEQDNPVRQKMIKKCKLFLSTNSRSKMSIPVFAAVGLSENELADYLLKTYSDIYGVEWDGEEPVHIDHIYPLCFFKGTPNEAVAWHYKNLQLIKAKDNFSKGWKLDYKVCKNS